MPVSISDFRSKFKSDPAKSSHFEVFIFPPLPLQGKYAAYFETGLTYKTNSCEIPGRILQTIENKTDPGPQRKIVNGSVYNDVGIDIEVTERWKERQFFQDWMNFTTNDDSNNPIADQNFTVKYHDDYVGRVLILAYGRGSPVPKFKIELMEAFPASIGAVQMSWESEELVRFRVDFTYRYFTSSIFQ